MKLFDCGTAWIDTGTFGFMNASSEHVHVIEKRTCNKVGDIEEAAHQRSFIGIPKLI